MAFFRRRDLPEARPPFRAISRCSLVVRFEIDFKFSLFIDLPTFYAILKWNDVLFPLVPCLRRILALFLCRYLSFFVDRLFQFPQITSPLHTVACPAKRLPGRTDAKKRHTAGIVLSPQSCRISAHRTQIAHILRNNRTRNVSSPCSRSNGSRLTRKGKNLPASRTHASSSHITIVTPSPSSPAFALCLSDCLVIPRRRIRWRRQHNAEQLLRQRMPCILSLPVDSMNPLMIFRRYKDEIFRQQPHRWIFVCWIDMVDDTAGHAPPSRMLQLVKAPGTRTNGRAHPPPQGRIVE